MIYGFIDTLQHALLGVSKNYVFARRAKPDVAIPKLFRVVFDTFPY